jgi:branched-chain amino acid transport system substrate-binding protein
MTGEYDLKRPDRRTIIRTIGGTSVALGLAGCTGINSGSDDDDGGDGGGGGSDGGDGGDGTDDDGDDTGTEEEPEEFKIGVSVPLSGRFSGAGSLFVPSCKAWEKKVNDAGGINGHTVEFQIEDNESDEARASRLASRFVSDEKDFIISAYSSPMMRAAAPAAEQAGIPIMNSSGVNFEMHGSFEYGFQFQPTLARNTTASLLNEAGITDVATWGVDLDWTTQSKGNFVDEVAPEHDLNIVYNDTHSNDQQDFSSFVLKAEDRGADALVTFNYPNTVIAQMRAIDNSSWEPGLVSSVTAGVQDVQDALGQELLDGTCVPVVWNENVQLEGNDEFKRLYREQSDLNLAEHAAMGWGTVQVFGEAIRDLGNDAKDGDTLREWFLDNEVDTILGTSDFDEDGIQQGYNWKETQWQGNEKPLVAPEDVKEADLQYPKTWP